MQLLLTFGILGLAIVILLIWVVSLELRLKRLFRGNRATSLESVIRTNQAEIEKLFAENATLRSTVENVASRIKSKIGTARTLRFNPFQGAGTGGNQSFATALLDEDKNGVVISSLYSRDKLSLFAKPIKKGTSEYELTEEEERVISGN